MLIVNTYADDYYGYTAHKCKGLILPESFGSADACHSSFWVSRMGGKQDLLKSLDVRVFQIPTYGNSC